MVFDVTNPNQPIFEYYANNRKNIVSTDSTDLGPEGIIFIPANESPNSKNLVILSNEISSSITIYEVTVPPVTSDIANNSSKVDNQQFIMYPNPVNDILNVKLPTANTKSLVYTIYDLKGNRMATDALKSDSVNDFAIPTNELIKGNYILILKADGKIFPKQFIVER
jgi:Secretion system C-terminal sorting domain